MRAFRRGLAALVVLLVVVSIGTAVALAAGPARHATLPAVSPDGRQVAYIREYAPDSVSLRVMRVDGSNDHAVTPAGKLDGVPGWSRDARRVLLAATEHDSSWVYSFDPRSGDKRLVAGVAGRSMRLSNDGLRTSYAVGSWTVARLWVADVDGSHARALTDSVGYWYNIAWSPDDRTIAVTHGDSARTMQVWAVDVTHAQAHPLTAFPGDQGRPQWPAWSADGKRVAVQAGYYDREHPETNQADVYVVEVSTGAVERVTPRDRVWMDETPTWCPDGRHLVIQSTRTGAFELWRIGVDGGKPVPLTHP